MNTLVIQHKQAADLVFTNKVKSLAIFRRDLQQLEDLILAVPGVTLRNDDRTPLTHLFTPNLYARKIEIPATYMLITGIHATEHIAVISKGSCLVATPDGIVKYAAGDVMVTKIGTKRAIFVIEDIVWTTVHAITANDPEEAINMIEFKTWEDMPCQFG